MSTAPPGQPGVPGRPGGAGPKRWVEVSASEYAHERSGLEYLKSVVPNASPYRAWTNFEFMDEQGSWHEIDALVLGRGRLHLVELKHYRGILTGDENTWRRGNRTERSPLKLARRKAQKLASRITRELRDLARRTGSNPGETTGWVPFIQECVFLHAEDLQVELTEWQASNLFTIAGSKNSLPLIEARLTEPPDRRVIAERDGQRLAGVMDRITGRRTPLRPAGSWQIEAGSLADGDGWQDWPAIHAIDPDRRARIRLFAAPPGSPTGVLDTVRRRVQREFTLLRTLNHESIVVPVDQVEDNRGEPGLVYEEDERYRPLDLLPERLSNLQQLEVLRQIAVALDYAHRKGVAHRGLHPGAVLVRRADAEIGIRLADWSSAARVQPTATGLATSIGTAGDPDAGGAALFEAPEGRWSSSANRPALDIFALGALAYWLVTSAVPAPTRMALRTLVRDGNGLDLAASTVPFADQTLRALILDATRPNVTERLDSAGAFATRVGSMLADQDSGNQSGGDDPAPPAVDHDPLTAPIGSLLGGRFEILADLGTGSTAKGIRVLDRSHDRRAVLKVAVNEAASDRLRSEAEALRAVGRELPDHDHLVELWEVEPEIGSGRVSLLLSDCGEDTLASQLRHGPITAKYLAPLGDALLSVVADLDRVGIMHRDIKPANIGLTARIGGEVSRLRLFDFSVTSGVGEISAGTPPYLDPFLADRHRGSYDSAAERYAAAVVLFEMATGSQPFYGTPLNAPDMVKDDVSVDVADFPDLPTEVSQQLTAFFRTALARDSRDRFDTPDAMRSEWSKALHNADRLSTRKTGGTTATPGRRTIAAPKEGTPFSLAEHVPSLAGLVDELTRTTKGTARQLVHVLTPKVPPPDNVDPLDTQAVLGMAVGVTPASISQQFSKLRSTWFPEGGTTLAGQALAELARQVHAALVAAGGVGTPEQLQEVILDAVPADPWHARALSGGILRLLLELQTGVALTEDGWERRRHGGSIVTIATDALLLDRADAVADEAERQLTRAREQGHPVLPTAQVLPELRQAFAEVAPQAPTIADSTLQHLAAVPPGIALTTAGDLYPVDLDAASALEVVLRSVPDTVRLSVVDLRERLRRRFPAATATLPNRPELDVLVRSANAQLQWFSAGNVYAVADAAPIPMSTMGTPPTITPTGSPSTVDLSWLPDARFGTVFRAVIVPMGMSDAVAEALQDLLPADRVDVTDTILTAMREAAATAGARWDELLAADAVAADHANLALFVGGHIAALVDRVESVVEQRVGQTGHLRPVVLTDLAVLAAYQQLPVIARWTDLTEPPPRTIIAVIPGGTDPTVDGQSLPLGSPEQLVRLPKNRAQDLVAAHHAMSSKLERGGMA